jgi:hypothetical protein
MADVVLEERVETLEELMAGLLRAQEHTQQQLDQTSREMRAFKDEMAEFKDEMRRDRRALRQTLAEQSERAQQRLDQTAHHMEQEHRALRQTLADLAHKMGTLAEDLVAPSIPRILHEVVGCPEAPSMLGVRLRGAPRARLADGRSQEYIERRSAQFVQAGVKALDALHLAAAEAGKADYFCTCDDRFLRRAKSIPGLHMIVAIKMSRISIS